MAGMHRPPAMAPGQKINFNTIPTPPKYVPGQGRGATGFTTRSDIGPARMAPEMPTPGQSQRDKEKRDQEKEDEADDSKFDEFMGNDAGAFSIGFREYDKDDREADKVWDDIDEHLDQRRRKTREKRLKEELEEMRKRNPKITETFADLKRDIAERMTADDWEAIPEIGDHTVKKQKRVTYTPVPDNILSGAAAAGASGTTVNGGTETPYGASTSLTEIGEGRKKMVDIQLGHASDSVTGQTVVDPKGYLTDLSNIKISSDAEVGDIKRARTLLKSVINTNPKHSPGWVAAARLEEVAGKLADARKLIAKGCELCPTAEDVWLEYVRLSKPEDAKAIVARGVAANPTSVRLWMRAAELELDKTAQSRVLRRALERVPTSVALWKAAIELADEDGARILLERAVDCCPQHTELWLALARLSSYNTAKTVLNKARTAIPTEPLIWITAAKLEEAQGNLDRPPLIIKAAIKSLQSNSVVIDRDYWLKQAEDAEKVSPPMVHTCKAIVLAVIEQDVDAEDRKRTWKADAEAAAKEGSVHTARAIYEHALQVFPGKKSIWKAAARLEKQHGTPESLDELLNRATKYCPQAEVLWLMAAKEKWLAGDLTAARLILNSAFNANEDKESVWLAAWKLEFENGEMKRAQGLLQRARDRPGCSTQRVWMKSAIVERELGDVEAERRILEEGLKRFPHFDKLSLMRGQLEARAGHREAAKAAYQAGLRRCIHSAPLWTSLARLEENAGNLARARVYLEQARLKNPGNELIWLAAVRTELRADRKKEAESLLAKALQECPTSGRLLAEQINLVPRPQRKTKSAEALKKANDDAVLIAAVARIFWSERRLDKGREWTERAVLLDPDIGDIWAMYYSFELQHDPERAQRVLERCVQQEPHHGERWQAVAKDPANAHQPVAEILRRVVAHMESVPLP